MFENITALDIGSSSVRMLTARTGLRNFQVTGLSIEDVIPEEGDSPTEAVRRAIERLLADSDPGNRTILCNLPMERAIVRNIAFPFSDVEKISAAIPYEAEENLPFSIDELIMDFQALKSPRTEEARIMLAATPIEAVREHVTILADSGLRPIRMGLEANALFECYRYFNRIPGENIIQVDIGHEKTEDRAKRGRRRGASLYALYFARPWDRAPGNRVHKPYRHARGEAPVRIA